MRDQQMMENVIEKIQSHNFWYTRSGLLIYSTSNKLK